MWRGVDETEFSSLQGGFAQAGLQRDLWLPALQSLAKATGSSRAELVGYSPQAPVFNWITDVDLEVVTDFMNLDGANPRVNYRIAASQKAAIEEIVHEAHYAEAIPLLESQAYVDFCERWGMTHGCQTTLVVDRDLLIGMSILRSRAEGETTPAHHELIAALAPHVRAAVRTQGALEGQGDQLVAGAFEAMGAAAFVLDGFGHVRRITPAAEVVAAAGDRLRLAAGRLRGASPREDDALRRHIARAANPPPGLPGDGVVALRGEGGGAQPLLLDILPLPREPWTFGFDPRVLVVVRKPARDGARLIELLMETYALTAAEADIAEQLSRGLSREDVARTRGVSLGTVRIQIKAIFRKMEVSREGELVARVGLFR
jgi:DNA-binding CsgD family transcriptional regulator